MQPGVKNKRNKMTIQAVKVPGDCSILIVDDDPAVNSFLKRALQENYRTIHTAESVEAATQKIQDEIYDLVVTDLKLPDGSGMDVLKTAKQKDPYTEVIMITGYATIDSAAEAINLGVTSYLLKPLSVDDFLYQVEKAVAGRIFHLKSVMLMENTDLNFPEIKRHFHDVAALYYFCRKLMLSLDITEIMRVILEEANTQLGAQYCAITVDFIGFRESFVMPRAGTVTESRVRPLIEKLQTELSAESNSAEKKQTTPTPITIFRGKKGQLESENLLKTEPITTSLSVLGKTIGYLSVVREEGDLDAEKSQFLYVFASITSSIVEHGYLDLQAKMQAKTDSLTGVANHRMFHETLEREIARADRHKHPFCLALIDIDDFKKINDTYGHLVGDAVLIDLTTRIAETVRCGDVLARYGGEEFALVLPDTRPGGALILAQRICEEVAGKPFPFSQKHLDYTVSIGLACYDGSQKAAKDDLISKADQALYESKRNGKNRVSVFN